MTQSNVSAGADLVELLAYSGCRLGEGRNIRWRDVDLQKNTLTVTGGEGGTKNHETRVIPMTDALRQLLLRLRDESKIAPDDFISKIDSAKKCLATACRRLNYPSFTQERERLAERL